MSTEWFCQIMGDEWGPMSSQELLAVARRGRLTRDDLVRKGAEGTWVRAEVIKGLFNNSPLAATATSHRAAITARPPLPAKRSVRGLRRKEYWIKFGPKTAGPFSGLRIRQLAAEGGLKPYYFISDDRIHWVRAAQVRSLAFGGADPKSATATMPSSAWALEALPPAPGGQRRDRVYSELDV